MGIVTLLITQPVFVESGSKNRLAIPENLNQSVISLSHDILNQASQAEILDAKKEWIYKQLSLWFPENTEYQDFDLSGVKYSNVISKVAGSESNCGLYVIGAHYDTYDNLPGADDNSSGVAGLIELARIYARNPPLCDVQLVAYTSEEPPYFRSEYMGSYIHAKSLSEKNVKVELMLSLEMIGYFSDEPESQKYPVWGMKYLYSDAGNFISLVGNLSQISIIRFLKKEMRKSSTLPVYSINAPTWVQGIDFSDHMNYWSFGFSAVMITDTAFNRNMNYHTEEDTAEKLDYKRMAQVVDVVYYAVSEHMNNKRSY
jgi:Zn-dependent M28 family amino/carboxypeptidase